MSVKNDTNARTTRECLERLSSIGSDPCLSTTTTSTTLDDYRRRSGFNFFRHSRVGSGGPRFSSGSFGMNFDRKKLVLINVSGKRFETYESTLQRFPDTLLGNPAKLIHFYNHDTNEYFFDRHRKAFNGILYYYQSNGILERPVGVSESLFTQEALFFGISQDALQYEAEECNELNELIQLPTNPYLCKIWVLFEQPNSSLTAKVLAIVSVLVIVLSIVVFCVESIPEVSPDTDEGRYMRETWLVLNTICNTWFTLEYVLRLMAAPKKFLFVRSVINIIDLISILPFYITVALGDRADSGGSGFAVLKVIRIFRVTRIFKLTRHSRGLHVLASTVRASSHELSMLVLFLAIGVILFSSALFYAEGSGQLGSRNKKFSSIPAAFWWAVVTMTTVGYGDLYPETTAGKLIGALCAVSGVLVVALPVPVIVSNFEYYYKQEKCRQAREDEVIKKLNQEGKFSPMKSSMKMIAEASITLAGQENEENDTVTYNPQKRVKDKLQTKISFHLSQSEEEEEAGGVGNEASYQDDILNETECTSPLIYDSGTIEEQRGLAVDSTPTLTPARIRYADESPQPGTDPSDHWAASQTLNNGHAVRKHSLTRGIAVA